MEELLNMGLPTYADKKVPSSRVSSNKSLNYKVAKAIAPTKKNSRMKPIATIPEYELKIPDFSKATNSRNIRENRNHSENTKREEPGSAKNVYNTVSPDTGQRRKKSPSNRLSSSESVMSGKEDI